MTWEELNEVQHIKQMIKNAERALETWRRAEALKIPTRDGLPKSKSVDSHVERLAVKIADASRRVDVYKTQLADAISRFEQKICAEVPDVTAQTLFILRYVDGMYFRDIALAMGYSEAHIYYLHRITCEKLIVD